MQRSKVPTRGQPSMRRRLTRIILVTTATSLLVAGLAMLRHDLRVYRQGWAAELATEARILGIASTPALAFDDLQAAERNLAAITARPALLSAAIYKADGERFASYAQPGEPQPRQSRDVSLTGTRIVGERVEISEPLMQGGEILGTIYLLARYDVTSRVTAYLEIFGLVMAVSMAVALLLSAALRRAITGPLDEMTNVAGQVISKRDYSLRAPDTRLAEVEVVVTAFNNMLQEVQSRTAELERSNESLQAEVAVRHATEVALRASEKLYRAIGESIDFGVWICDARGRNIYASESFLRLAGMTQEECSSLGWGNALHPDDAEATIAAWQECVRTGSSWYREHRFRGADGEYHAILAQGVPVYDDAGAATGWAGINLDISRLKNTEEALRRADQRKDEFLATLAHELRNPLAPIRHAAKLLESADRDAGQRLWAREVIARQVQRMSLLLDDLLDVSRITRGRLELRKERVRLAALVQTAVETARPLIDAKKHDLTVALPPEALEVYVDPLRLSQALSNLLTNAAKYMDAGGHIQLRVWLAGNGLNFAVRDRGIGLEQAVIPTLFEMFSQVESAIDRSEGGLGIGLALVNGLVTLHGGEVSASSQGLGRGSEFVIRLPVDAVLIKDSVQTAVGAAPAPHRAGARCRIVVADDNRDAAAALSRILAASGHAVATAFSGAEALAVCERERPQAVILDIGMPDMTGYEVAQAIRAADWGRTVLLLAITGWGHEEDKARARAAGFDHHLTKPAEPEEIERLIDTYLAAQGAPSEQAS
ncbi:MAG: ATP-binding protein [Pseudomonadota bacterium]